MDPCETPLVTSEDLISSIPTFCCVFVKFDGIVEKFSSNDDISNFCNRILW